MASSEINGSPTAMNTFATGLNAPAMPASLARLGTPPNLSGMFEGIAMALLDKAATAEVSAYLAKVTEDMATYQVKVNTAATSYSLADVDSSLELVTSGAKFATEGISFVKQLTGMGSGTTGSTGTTGTTGATGTTGTQPTTGTGTTSSTGTGTTPTKSA